MKKLFALMLALLMVLSFAACGDDDKGACEECGKMTSNHLEYEGESAYICDECCEETTGMSFKEFKQMMKAAQKMQNAGALDLE